MLDPAGDAKHTGRKIDNSFERGITLQCAQKLKAKLETYDPAIKVVLTRSAGEVVQPLQHANFANRMAVDLYVSMHCFQDMGIKPKLYIYHFCHRDNFVNNVSDLAFYTYDHAYLFSHALNQAWAGIMYNTLQQEPYARLFDVSDVISFPYKPLIGIKVPALALELGLKTKTDWQNYIEPIAQGIKTIIDKQRDVSL